MKASYSGLMNYLFGKDRSKKITKDAFLKFRGQIIDEILWLEFTRYCKTLPDLPGLPPQNFPIITDVEFCEHLLAHANIPSKKKKAMVHDLFLRDTLKILIKVMLLIKISDNQIVSFLRLKRLRNILEKAQTILFK